MSDTHVKEFIVDAETDPDEINIRMFDTSSRKGSIKSYRTVPIEKLENGTKLMLKNGIVYHVPDKACYKIIGHYELMKFDRYEGLNEMSMVYSYPGLKEDWESHKYIKKEFEDYLKQPYRFFRNDYDEWSKGYNAKPKN